MTRSGEVDDTDDGVVPIALLSDIELFEVCRYQVWRLENTRKAIERRRRAVQQLRDRAHKYPAGASALLARVAEAERAAQAIEADCQRFENTVRKIQAELERRNGQQENGVPPAT